MLSCPNGPGRLVLVAEHDAPCDDVTVVTIDSRLLPRLALRCAALADPWLTAT